jgi:hypothetical protein
MLLYLWREESPLLEANEMLRTSQGSSKKKKKKKCEVFNKEQAEEGMPYIYRCT